MLEKGLQLIKYVSVGIKKLLPKKTPTSDPYHLLRLSDSVPTPYRVKTPLEAFARYGSVVGSTWARESHWMSLLEVSDIIGSGCINSATGKPLVHIYCNKDMQPALKQSLLNLKTRGLLGQLKTFDGCFEIRPVRGYSIDLSTHSFGLACDWNAATNPLGGPSTLTPEFVTCFTDAGFVWGGNFRRRDSMHFSLGWEK